MSELGGGWKGGGGEEDGTDVGRKAKAGRGRSEGRAKEGRRESERRANGWGRVEVGVGMEMGAECG